MAPLFPFAAPPIEERFPPMRAQLDAYAVDAEVLTWFMRERGHRAAKDDSPFWRWIRSLRSYAKGDAGQDVPFAERNVAGATASAGALAGVCDLYAARLAAHAIRTIEGAVVVGRVGKFEPHASFVARELGGKDRTECGHPAMPSGVGTLYAAAACARRGGDHLTLFGNDKNSGKGRDIQFIANGATIRYECKARPFADMFSPAATAEDTLLNAIGKIAEASRGLRRRTKQDNVEALQVVQISAFAPLALAVSLHKCDVNAALRIRFRATSPYEQPHAVVLHWFGVDVVDRTVVPESRPLELDNPSARRRPSGPHPVS